MSHVQEFQGNNQVICRFYKDDPEENDMVVAAVREIGDAAVYCTLPAYGDREVMLPTSEINVRRGKRVTDYVKVGALIPCMVLRIDGEKIDVSMKKCREEEGKAALETYHRAARVDLIVRTASTIRSTRADGRSDLTNQCADKTTALYRDVVWPLDLAGHSDLYALFEEFRMRIEDDVDTGLPPELVAAIRVKVGLTPKTAEREIMLRFGPYHDGVARIQAELERLASLEGIEVFVVAAPKFRLVATDKTTARATARLEAALATVPAPT